jgi:aspartate carbamoyltransferase catalytic subunit
MRRHFGTSGEDLKGVKVSIVGDILHSRVARSNVLLLHTLGAKVTVIAPPTLMPFGIDSWPCEYSYQFDKHIKNTDALMMLRVQAERMNNSFFPTQREYSRSYGLDDDRLAILPSSSIVMHPGPMNRGLEITSTAADEPRSVIVEQVSNGVNVRMSVLFHLLEGVS